MSQTDTHSTMPAIRSFRAVPLSLEVLIEVPELKCVRTRRGKTQPRWRANSSRPIPGRARRRLRREVRVAGCALMVLMPIVSACTMGWSNRTSRIVACSIVDTTAENRMPAVAADRDRALEPGNDGLGESAAVALSTEPAPLVRGNDTEVPVVFTGYLLPDDSLEDSAHEGR
jgi:hypothetical protein